MKTNPASWFPAPANCRRTFLSARIILTGAGALLSICAYSQSNYAAPYTFTTLAGNPPGATNGIGTAARFNSPRGIAIDKSGNFYVADALNNEIRKITAAGNVTTLAGTAGREGAADGVGSAAEFSDPEGLALDSAGNVYVADSGNYKIRMVTPAGVVSTIAGAPPNYSFPQGQDGTGTAARFSYPVGLALDGAGNIYVADQDDAALRQITPRVRSGVTSWVVTTLAGLFGSTGSTDGTGSVARFSDPFGVALDGAGNVYVTDIGADTIRKVSPTASNGVTTWAVTTLAGTPGQQGSADGTGAAAQFFYPSGLVVDGAGNLYVADSFNDTIRKVTPSAVVSTLAGTASIGSSDGIGDSARFYYPTSVALDGKGNVFVADQGNDIIREVTRSGVVTTLAGVPGTTGANDGPAAGAQFNQPFGVAVDGAENVYVADSGNDTIREIAATGTVTTIAGLDGSSGNSDGTGSSARFNSPHGLAVDGAGNIYVADTNNDTIRKMTPAVANGSTAWTVTTLVDASGGAFGNGGPAQFSQPYSIAVDGIGNVYVPDTNASVVSKITPSGILTVLAGNLGPNGSKDGTGSAAEFLYPDGVAADSFGDVYVADTGNYTIRKIAPNGTVTTLAGVAGQFGSKDGIGSAARFWSPNCLAVDVSGTLYVADEFNNAIRKGTAGGDGAIGNAAPRGSGELILLVDDEKSVCETGAKILARHGYRAITATDGANAIEVFTPRASEVRLVLTDLEMPNVDGLALVAALRKLNPRLPVVVMTGGMTQGNEIQKGFGMACLPKPFDVNTLLSVVRRTLDEAALAAIPHNT